MVDKFRMRCAGTQLIESLVHCAPNDSQVQCPSNCIQTWLGVAGTSDPLQLRTPLPKLDILAVDADEGPPERVGSRERRQGGKPLVPYEVKTAREKEIKYLWDMEVYEYSTEAEALARTGRNPVGLKWIDTHKGSAEAPRCRSRLVCSEVRYMKGSNRSSRQHLSWKLCASCSVLRVKKTSFKLRTLS